jgi:hypothetical protein
MLFLCACIRNLCRWHCIANWESRNPGTFAARELHPGKAA